MARDGFSWTLRVFSARLQLAGQVKRLVDKGLLRPGPGPITKLYFYEYADASPVLTWSFIALRIGLLCCGAAFQNADKDLSEITELFPVILGFVPETTDVVQYIRRITAPMYRTISQPFKYEDHSYEFCYRLEKADNSMLSKLWGNNCSGYHKCSFCTVSLRKLKLLFNYCHLRSKCKAKSLLWITQLRASRPKEAEKYGLKAQQVLMPDYDPKMTASKNIEEAGLKDLQLALDNLHNCHGFLGKVLQLEKAVTSTKDFLTALFDVTGRDAISKLEDKEHRLVFTYYEDIFLPVMRDGTRKTDFTTFCQLWNEVLLSKFIYFRIYHY
jgi:hypothetical protein